MAMALLLVGVVAVALGTAWWARREQTRRLLEAHTISPEQLYELLASDRRPRIFDVRVPLDLLANSEIIPGSERIEPKVILANPSLVPKDENAVVYCTCPGDATSRTVIKRALAMQYTNPMVLRGGLAAWKAKGYPVERYETPFHLDTPA